MRKVLDFKKAAEELPKKSGEYLCYIDEEWIVLWFSKAHGLFNAYDHWPKKEAKRNAIHVTYWAALPKGL